MSPRHGQNPHRAWTLAAWQFCWKCSTTGIRLTLTWPSAGYSSNMTHFPRWRGTKQPQSSSATSVPSLGAAGDDWQSTGASSGSCEHKSVVNFLVAKTHSIQIPHPLRDGTGTVQVVFKDHSEECAFFVGCGLSRSSCWLPWLKTTLSQDATNGFSSHTIPSSNITLMHTYTSQHKDFFALFILFTFHAMGIKGINGTPISLYVIWLKQT